jgi:hypothetical protein
MKKHKLCELFFVIGQIPKQSSINSEDIKNHILKNINKDNKFNSDNYLSLHDYYNIPFEKNIGWINDYIIDHYFAEFDASIYTNEVDTLRALIQQKNQSVLCHNNILAYHLKETPDLDCIYTIDIGEKPSYLILKYSNGRNKELYEKIPLRKNQFIIIPSFIDRYITQNENEAELINLTMHYKMV